MSKAKAEPLVFKWSELQTRLIQCSDEEELTKMLDAEKKGPARLQWLMRIHGRLNLIRAMRERTELIAIVGNAKGA